MWRAERPTEHLSDQQERELAFLDGLFEPGAAPEPGAEHASLVALALAVRDIRPAVRPGFVDELDARMAARFPRRESGEDRPRVSTAGGGRRQGWLLGTGLAATLAAVVALTLPGGRSAPSSSSAVHPALLAPSTDQASTSAGVARAVPVPVPVPNAATPRPVPAPVPNAAPRPGTDRAVQRDASLTLLARRDRVQAVADAAIAAIDRLGGIVASSDVSLDDHGGSQATIEVRVPGDALGRALTALSALGHVSSRSQSTLDITDATAGARDRLAQSRAERAALLRQLGRATSPNQVASIHAQLGLVTGRIVQDQAQVRTLVSRGSFAHLGLTINEEPQAAGRSGGSSWGPGAALSDALAVLEAVFAVAVVALAALVPAALLTGLALAAYRPLRRRWREAVLADNG